VGDAFTDAQIDDALERIAKRYQQRAEKKGGDVPPNDPELRAAIEELTQEDFEQSLIDKRVRAAALRARTLRKRAMESLPPDLNEAQKLAAVNVGTEKRGSGTGLSVDARRRAVYNEWVGEIARELDALGTLGRLANPLRRRDKDFEYDVAREIARLNGSKDRPTGNEDAVKTARILKRVQDKSVAAQNAQGAWISRLEGYVVKQTHDAIKISGGFFRGLDAKKRVQAQNDWIDFITPRLDERSFDGVTDRAAFLRQIWTDIVSGHQNISDATKSDLDAVRASGLLAARVSESRVLHFKNTDDWIAYNERFGSGGVFENFMSQLDQASSNAALMEVWGPNPKASFDATKESLIKAARERGDVKTVAKLNSHLRDAEFGELDGTSAAPGSVRGAAIMRGLRLHQGLTKLGGMTLSSISDTSLAAHTLRKAGVPLLEGYNSVLSGISRLQGDARAEAASLVNVGARQIIGNMVSRFSATDGAVGTLGRIQSQFYTLNLFSAWGGGVRSGVGASLSHHLGGHSGKVFGSLDEATQAQLTRYKIGAPEWALLRKGAKRFSDNNLYLTPEAADGISEAALKKWGRGQGYGDPVRARTELRTRLQAYFTDLADTAMTEPRAREQALLNQGLPPGTPMGEAVRAFMQFKSFPTAVITRHLAPAYRGDAGVSPVAGVAHIIVAGTILGYVARQSKQIAKGLSPEPLITEDGAPNMPLLVASLIQGGGLGIYGDFLLADYNRYGSGPVETLGGPLVGAGGGVLRFMAALRDGEDVWARGMRGTIGAIPFNNLFYTRAALDYLIFYQMQEWANPGSLERYEKRLQEDRGQSFLLPPSEFVN
jgi:hypothetical protein